jgi:hypothetical protein
VTLRPAAAPPRLDCGQLRLEPAIAALDWLFTPSPRLEKPMHGELLQASTRFYSRFTLPTARSIGFGSYSCDFRHFHTLCLACAAQYWFPCGCVCKRLILATKIHSLARYSKRTVEHLSALPHYHYKVSDSLNSLLRVLFNFPSRYYFAIGLMSYLGLEVDASQFLFSFR